MVLLIGSSPIFAVMEMVALLGYGFGSRDQAIIIPQFGANAI
jgi:hypothetical protein